MKINFKIFLLFIVVSVGSSFRSAHPEMDPVSGIIIYGVGSTAAALITYAGIESYNVINQDTNQQNREQEQND